MTPSFQPKFHQEVQCHTGPVWHLTGAPSNLDAQAEQQQLAREGCIVVWPAGEPGTGFMPSNELREDVRFVARFLALQVAIWAVIRGVLAFKDTHPAYAVALVLAALPCVISAGIRLGDGRAPRHPSTQ